MPYVEPQPVVLVDLNGNPYKGVDEAAIAANYQHRFGQLAGVDAGGAIPVTLPSIAAVYPGGSQGAATEARGLAVRGRYAYVAANNHFYVLDISTPSAPVAIADLNNLETVGAQDLVLRGRYAYVYGIPGNVGVGISVIDITNANAPVMVGSLADAANIRSLLGGLEVKGRYAYVTSYTNGGNGTLAIYDISSVTPVYVGKLDNSALARAVDVKVRGKYAYVGIEAGGVIVVDVSNPFAPSQVAAAGGGSYQAISGKYLYSVANQTVSVVNIANPAAPNLVGSWTDATSTYLNSAFRVDIAGRYLYVASRIGNGVVVLDVSNPAAPTLVGAYTAGATPSTLDHPVNVQAVGRYLYVSCGSYASFGVLDIGGIEQTAAKIDTLAAATLDVAERLSADRVNIGDALTVGAGGVKAEGPVTLQGGANLRSGSGAPALDGLAGKDWYFRTDTPGTANQRLYVCTTTGAAGSAVWTGIV